MDEPPAPYLPFKWDENEPGSRAIQAVWDGVADEHQQKLAMETIVAGVCRYYDLSYRPCPRDTAFAEGMRHVGAQLVKLGKINYSRVLRKSRENSEPKQS